MDLEKQVETLQKDKSFMEYKLNNEKKRADKADFDHKKAKNDLKQSNDTVK